MTEEGFRGRPKEGGGHSPLNLSLDTETRGALEKIMRKGGNASRFVEERLEPHVRNLDPGEPCKYISEIDRILRQGISEAFKQHDYGMVETLGALARKFDNERRLCQIPSKD